MIVFITLAGNVLFHVSFCTLDCVQRSRISPFALSSLFHTVLFHRSFGKFTFQDESSYFIGTVGYEDVDCEVRPVCWPSGSVLRVMGSLPCHLSLILVELSPFSALPQSNSVGSYKLDSANIQMTYKFAAAK